MAGSGLSWGLLRVLRRRGSNRDGRVAETGGAAVFIVRDGVVSTPSITESVLESITRSLVIELLLAEGVPVVERPIDRTELYIADEVFLAGTLAEITPVTRIDRFEVGHGVRGQRTAVLQASYSQLCHGTLPGFERWTTPLSIG